MNLYGENSISTSIDYYGLSASLLTSTELLWDVRFNINLHYCTIMV